MLIGSMAHQASLSHATRRAGTTFLFFSSTSLFSSPRPARVATPTITIDRLVHESPLRFPGSSHVKQRFSPLRSSVCFALRGNAGPICRVVAPSSALRGVRPFSGLCLCSGCRPAGRRLLSAWWWPASIRLGSPLPRQHFDPR